MELDEKGLVKSSSVREVKRIRLKQLEHDRIRYRLAIARRGQVRVGEIAVIGDREWLRVDSQQFKGLAWIEIG